MACDSFRTGTNIPPLQTVIEVGPFGVRGGLPLVTAAAAAAATASDVVLSPGVPLDGLGDPVALNAAEEIDPVIVPGLPRSGTPGAPGVPIPPIDAGTETPAPSQSRPVMALARDVAALVAALVADVAAPVAELAALVAALTADPNSFTLCHFPSLPWYCPKMYGMSGSKRIDPGPQPPLPGRPGDPEEEEDDEEPLVVPVLVVIELILLCSGSNTIVRGVGDGNVAPEGKLTGNPDGELI
jgi:hypothetical protein